MEDAEVGKLTQHIPTFLTGVEFKLYTSEEVKKISVLEITNTVTFNDLAHPTEGGLCDLRLGPSTKDSICETCDGTFSECNGHYGHISLSLPVFNPLLIRHTYQLLKLICFQCKRFLFKRVHFEVVLAQLKALELGLDYFVDELKDTSKLLITDQTGDTPDDIEIVAATLDQLIAIEISTGSNAKETTPLKNVVERRQKLFRELLWGKLVRPEKDCAHCNAKKKAVTIVNNSVLMISVPKRGKKKVDLENTATEEDNILNETITETTSDVTLVSGKSYFTPLEAREHLRELWKNEQRALKAIFGIFEIDGTSEYPTDIFFLDTILVCPNRFRPLRQRNGKQFEHERTAALNLIMVASNSLGLSFRNVQASTSAKMKSSLVAQLHYSWQRLQVLCNRLYDCDMDRTRDSRKLPGVKQVLEKKEGLFRKHMMGKRVNYAARSVISPDPYIMADEVGVPLVFATKLTYPEYVTKWNLRKLKEAVLNGPAKHPGAVSVQLENGSVIRLRADNPTQRRALANRIGTSLGYQMAGCKVVYRHLVTGDVLLLNRQPTLHKPSIMAHKVKVLPSEKTMRLHYANCKCYNADFDGDEMNAHFPQSEFGRAEAYNIANVARQFLVPKDGTPLSGLIQDHIIGTTLISIRGSFFCQADYNQLVFGALSFLNKRIKVLPPTIIKPIQLWSGKQVISTIILNIVQEKKYPPSLEIPSKVRHKTFICKPTKSLYWSPIQPGDMCESGVIIRNGELLCGVLDKSNIGPSQNGLIHCCYELYGGKVSNWLLTSFARVASNYLQIISGFSLGIHDILVKKPANKERRKLIEMSRTTGDEVTAQGLNVTEAHDEALIKDKYQDAHLSKDTVPLKQLDRAMKTQTDEITNKISGVCLPGLVKTFPHNNLQLMIQAGAKGGTVNALQISCLLGQIELEGRRVPLMMSGRSLPSFEPYDTSPRAGGFVSGRFLTGIRPQEFFFHCMAGREGLIDTAVKTSRSGYLQRCLIKHLEGLVVNYDLTVRDSDGSVIQFLYGEDGLDVSKSQLLKPDALNVLIRNYPSVKCDEREKLEAQTDKTKIEDIKASKEDWMSLNGSNIYKKRIGSMFNEYAQRLKDEIEKELEKVGKTPTYSDLRIAIDSWFQLSKEERALLNKYWLPCPGPVLGNVRPDSNYGAISEKLEDMVIDYMNKNPDKLLCKYSLSRVDDVDFTKEKYKPPITYDAFWNLIFDCYIRSLCDPGEAVGLLSAQSVGEPSTQMTLNTFHFAGRGDMNVTLGIPRLREIIMTASPNISTPNMDIPFRQRHDIDMENVAEKMRMKLNSVKLSDVLETVDVVEKLVLEERECSRIYEITFQFLPRECYRDKTLITPNYILNFMETKFLSILLDAIAKKMKYQSRYDSLYGHSVIIREKKPANNDDEGDEENIVLGQFKNAPDEEASSDEDEEIEGDTTAAKSKARRDQDLGYEEPEEVEKQDKDSDLDDDDDKEEHELEQDGNVSGQEDEVQLVAVIKRKKLNLKFAVTDEEKEERIKNVEESSTFIASYDFDSVHQQWCKVQIRYELAGSKIDMCCVVEDEAKKCRIYKVGKIERAFLVKDQHAPNGGFDQMLKTEGVSFTQLAKFADVFDLRRIYSNDIHAVANTFGIEAARKVIQMEITSVFAAYGIKVDARHLSLISDYMTFDGTIKGMNRMSMTMSSSPIQQMTFETTTAFLKSAVMLGFKDDLTSPSARIFAGCPPAGGTGCVELRQKIVELPPSPTKILYEKYKAIESSWSYGSKSASMSMMSNRSFSGFSSPSPSKKLKLNWD